MPYIWTPTETTVLRLHPHRSLPRRGFAAVIFLAFGLGILPLFGVLGTSLLWVILPFILLMVAGLWWGLERSYRDGDIREELRCEDHHLTLIHHAKDGPAQIWRCNLHWARAELHPTQGPVPNYLTLAGNGRRVEIGRFLSEEERQQLFVELEEFLFRKGGG